jgi:outer membrane protein assembly factor BamB
LQGAAWDPSAAIEVAAPKAAVANQLPNELDLRWEFKADEAIEATPAVGGGRVFVADALGQIYAIDKADGKELWRHNYNTGFLASPALQGNLLVIGDVEGNLYAIEADTGKQRWAASTDGEISAAASFHKDNVLVTSRDGKLYCFSIADGSAVWSYETDDQIRCSPTVFGDRTFLGGCDGSLHIVDLYTGKAIGNPLPLGGPTGSTPVVRDSKVFLPIMDGAVLSLDWVADKEIWRYEDEEQLQEYRSDAAVSDKMVIVSSQSKQVDAISVETGKLMWRHTLRRRADASPVIAGDEVWIAATDGRLIRLSLENGREEKPSYEIRGSFLSAPVIAGDQLFIADDKGVVRCFSKRRPPAAVRHFVCLVVDADRITFEGQATTWETLPKLLEKVPNRPFTVFEFAFASDDLPKRQKSDAIARCVRMNEQFTFEYPSYTGIKPLGSKGSLSQDRTEQDARARY